MKLKNRNFRLYFIALHIVKYFKNYNITKAKDVRDKTRVDLNPIDNYKKFRALNYQLYLEEKIQIACTKLYKLSKYMNCNIEILETYCHKL